MDIVYKYEIKIYKYNVMSNVDDIYFLELYNLR